MALSFKCIIERFIFLFMNQYLSKFALSTFTRKKGIIFLKYFKWFVGLDENFKLSLLYLFIPWCVLGWIAHSGSLTVRWQITGVKPSPSPMWAPGIKLDGKYLYMLSHFAGPDAVFKNKYIFFNSIMASSSFLPGLHMKMLVYKTLKINFKLHGHLYFIFWT